MKHLMKGQGLGPCYNNPCQSGFGCAFGHLPSHMVAECCRLVQKEMDPTSVESASVESVEDRRFTQRSCGGTPGHAKYFPCSGGSAPCPDTWEVTVFEPWKVSTGPRSSLTTFTPFIRGMGSHEFLAWPFEKTALLFQGNIELSETVRKVKLT